MKPAGWCIYFRSVLKHDTCEAGVEYRKAFPGPLTRAPCFLLDDGTSRNVSHYCPFLTAPTREQAEEAEADWDKAFTKIHTTMAHIAPWRKQHRGTNHNEVVKCPICNGRLHLSIFKSNNHVHAQCETKNCVRWME